MKAGSEAAVVESVKAASDIYAPAGGTITAPTALEKALKVNEDPEGAGWFFKLKLTDRSEFVAMVTAAYAKTVESL